MSTIEKLIRSKLVGFTLEQDAVNELMIHIKQVVSQIMPDFRHIDKPSQQEQMYSMGYNHCVNEIAKAILALFKKEPTNGKV